jgi:serine/threonine protein kinase
MHVPLRAMCPECFRPPGAGCDCAARDGAEQPYRNPFTLPRGTLLHGQYRVGRVLGSGGFGVTYVAWDERLETRVAIKEYFPRDFARRDLQRGHIVPIGPLEREPFGHGLNGFLNEARALAKFDHPHIVQVRTYFEANGTGYIVMHYYDGLDLGCFLQRRGRLGEKDALGIMLPVLDGLQAVHQRGLLHRDIKPLNIYLAMRPQPTPILLDFGAARVAVGEKSRKLSVIWTDGYAPLEQYSSQGRQGPWTDIYACGATLYHLVTGTVPPNAPDRAEGDCSGPLRALRPRLSEPFCAAVERALAISPAARPQRVHDLQGMLADGAPVKREAVVRDGVRAPRIVSCPRCGAQNRMREPIRDGARPSARPHCGKCGARLDP